jgi:hypothetical protein
MSSARLFPDQPRCDRYALRLYKCIGTKVVPVVWSAPTLETAVACRRISADFNPPFRRRLRSVGAETSRSSPLSPMQ